MVAILYLVLITYFGDSISRLFYRPVSVLQRLSTSFLIGLVTSTWITYLGALAFSTFTRPILMGNVVYFVVFAALINWLPGQQIFTSSVDFEDCTYQSRHSRFDWAMLLTLFVFCCWLMFATLNFRGGKFLIGFKGWTDFGANVSLLQSFVFGHNFPTQHPFFPGEPIRYHFLFWFQCANLEFLGLNPIWAVNVLSIFSLFALLILIMTLAEKLFRSRVPARIAAVFFLFSSSLYYIPFLRSQNGLSQIFRATINRTDFLPSGYPFRGEDWGSLTVSVFGYQRHLISAIGILLIVLVLLIDGYQKGLKVEESSESSRLLPIFPRNIDPTLLKVSIFCGSLIGLLPFWNSPTYVSALAIIGCCLFMFRNRLYLLILLGTAVVLGMPQVFLVRPRTFDQPFFRWGYVMDNPSILQVVKYLGWSFGLKWVLILIAMVWLSKAHRKFFLALSSLLILVFFFQLSTDVFNNHKLLNTWSIFASIYGAYGLWLVGRRNAVGVVLASLLGLATIFGGLVDLFPLHNDAALTVPYKDDRLTDWLMANTKPDDVFLSQTYLTHPILFTGRKIYLGNTLYAWSAGYAVAEREEIYRRMFQERDPIKLVSLLRKQNISYVAIDSGVRSNKSITDLNEEIYQQHFEKVFDDTDQQYDYVSIYRVPP